MRPLSYARATDVASAIATVSANRDSAFLAGGTTEIDLMRLTVVQPKLLVVMGEDAVEFVNKLAFPLSDRLDPTADGLQRFTATIDALVVPDIDASLDEQSSKTRFWNAFKSLGPWWAEQPPY